MLKRSGKNTAVYVLVTQTKVQNEELGVKKQIDKDASAHHTMPLHLFLVMFTSLRLYVCMYVCTHICMHTCMHAYMCAWKHLLVCVASELRSLYDGSINYDNVHLVIVHMQRRKLIGRGMPATWSGILPVILH